MKTTPADMVTQIVTITISKSSSAISGMSVLMAVVAAFMAVVVDLVGAVFLVNTGVVVLFLTLVLPDKVVGVRVDKVDLVDGAGRGGRVRQVDWAGRVRGRVGCLVTFVGFVGLGERVVVVVEALLVAVEIACVGSLVLVVALDATSSR